MSSKVYPDSEVRYFDGIDECVRFSMKVKSNPGTYRVFEYITDEPDNIFPVKLSGTILLNYAQVKRLMEEVM